MAISQDNLERLGPRLRVVLNGDAEVNALRAELSAAVEAQPSLREGLGTRQMLQQAVSRPEQAGTLGRTSLGPAAHRRREGELLRPARRSRDRIPSHCRGGPCGGAICSPRS